jgi:hypothetical protein
MLHFSFPIIGGLNVARSRFIPIAAVRMAKGPHRVVGMPTLGTNLEQIPLMSISESQVNLEHFQLLPLNDVTEGIDIDSESKSSRNIDEFQGPEGRGLE